MVKITIESTFWQSCKPLVLVVERACQYISNESFVTIVSGLISKCLSENSNGIISAAGDKMLSELTSKATNMIATSYINIVVGDCLAGDFGNCSSSTKNVYLSPGWIGQMQRVYERSGNLGVHQALLVVKIIHEYAHSLTPEILKVEHAVRVEFAKTNTAIPVVMFEDTSKKAGYKFMKKGVASKDDMGFLCEELLSGGFRFNQGVIEDDYEWNLEFIWIYKYDEANYKFEKVHTTNYDALVTNISSSEEPKLSDFTVHVAETVSTASKQASKRDYTETGITSSSPGEKVPRTSSVRERFIQEIEEVIDGGGSSDYDETGFCEKYGFLESGGNRNRKV